MKVVINSEVDLVKWEQLLKTNRFSNPFQTKSFFDFSNSVEGQKAEVFAVEHDDAYSALIVVVIQKEKGVKSFFSRRAIVYGGPLLGDVASAAFLLALVKKVLSRRVIYVEVRNYFDYSAYNDTFSNVKFKFVNWLNYHLDIVGTEKQLMLLNSSRRRQVKKALSQGVEWREAKSLEEVSQFYSILNALYVEKIKKPLFPLDYFLRFYKEGQGKILLVVYQGLVIGGIVCPIYQDRVIYEFYVCGLDQEYKNQYPSIMATWAAIEYANQHNIKRFDFMGAGSPDENYGVREFKARFGGELVSHGRFLLVNNLFLYWLGQIGLKVLSKLSK